MLKKYFNPKEFNASYDSDTDAIVFSLKNDPAEPISVPLAASYKAIINRYYKVVAQYRQKERDRQGYSDTFEKNEKQSRFNR